MNELQTHISDYLNYCRAQKRLDEKTLKAYRIDLRQFTEHFPDVTVSELTSSDLENHISTLHRRYKPKTVKRKIASAKAFFHYLEYREIIDMNPFNKIQIRFREPALLPKTIPLYTVEAFLSVIYQQQQNATTAYQRRNALRDAAAIELLFATGMRISELCSLKECDVDLYDATVLIYGKGRKERRIQIGSEDVVRILTTYFANQSGKAFSDQAVRRMICKYSSLASIEMHITPHMFRHNFATCLLEADVDIRFIQEMLGHSSINVTEIYTHVAVGKQRDILRTKHPRMGLRV